MFDSNLLQCLISEKKIKCENLMNANGDGREVIEIFCMDLWSGPCDQKSIEVNCQVSRYTMWYVYIYEQHLL